MYHSGDIPGLIILKFVLVFNTNFRNIIRTPQSKLCCQARDSGESNGIHVVRTL